MHTRAEHFSGWVSWWWQQWNVHVQFLLIMCSLHWRSMWRGQYRTEVKLVLHLQIICLVFMFSRPFSSEICKGGGGDSIHSFGFSTNFSYQFQLDYFSHPVADHWFGKDPRSDSIKKDRSGQSLDSKFGKENYQCIQFLNMVNDSGVQSLIR